MERWATFDCYGTLVDWNGGIREQLERLFGVERADELLARFHRLEPEIQAATPRRLVPRGAHDRPRAARRGDRADAARGRGERARPLAAVVARVRRRASGPDATRVTRGWRLGILSNTDRDLLDASMRRRSASQFDDSIVAGEIGSYKPAHRHWEVFREHHRGRTRSGTCTSPRASSTTSCLRPSSGSRRSGSTGSSEPEDARPRRDADRRRGPRARARRARPRRRLMSSLRARCPDCRTFTAVAVGLGVRVPQLRADVRAPASCASPAPGAREARGWLTARRIPLPVSRGRRRGARHARRAGRRRSPRRCRQRPVVVGGCCCTPRRSCARARPHGSSASRVVWIDAHGDLNTPETSPSGNEWGMPFRMILDSGGVAPEDAALVGARNLDPPEGGVHGGRRARRLARACARRRRRDVRGARPGRARSEPRSTCSSPSPTVPRPTSSKRSLADSPPARRSPGSASPASCARSGTRARRADARRGRILSRL